jgi:hypothetical protein
MERLSGYNPQRIPARGPHIHATIMRRTPMDDPIQVAMQRFRIPDGFEDHAARIRESIKALCVKVAKASGPLFRDHVSAEERAMLEKIFDKI